MISEEIKWMSAMSFSIIWSIFRSSSSKNDKFNIQFKTDSLILYGIKKKRKIYKIFEDR